MSGGLSVSGKEKQRWSAQPELHSDTSSGTWWQGTWIQAGSPQVEEKDIWAHTLGMIGS